MNLDTGLSVDVTIQSPEWTTLGFDPATLCPNIIETARARVKPACHGEVSVALINDSDMQALNKKWRGKDKPTNVLSFPDSGPAPVLGDIVIAFETVFREAEAANKPVQDHFIHLLVHGFLHLTGYDHMNDQDAKIMEALEISILTNFNIDNPYEINEPYET
jgi:probable rRNA maturation factor